MNDEKIWLETEDGQKLFIIKSEKIDMQEELNKTIENLYKELQRKDNIINELEESINNFDVFKEFTFPLMKRDEEQQVISSIDYEWIKSIKEPFLDKLKELKEKK